jgi:hypothetical protein
LQLVNAEGAEVAESAEKFKTKNLFRISEEVFYEGGYRNIN